MTSKQIEQRAKFLYRELDAGEEALWEISLQLAIHNERQAEMQARYMEMTAPAVKHYKGGPQK